MDTTRDMSRDNTVLLTYEELAARLGIDVQSARRRVVRHKWPRMRGGNDGKARAWVPAHVLPPEPATVPATTVTAPASVRDDVAGDVASSVPATVPATPDFLARFLSQAEELDVMREREADLREKLARAEGALDGYTQLLGRADRELSHVRERLDRAEDQRDAERAGRIAAEARAEAAAAAEEELAQLQAGGRLARVWRALTR